MMTVPDRRSVSSHPEDEFVDLFAQVFGMEKVQLLAYELPVEDIYGNSRLIDYALRTPDAKVAFEIDGLTWHHPSTIPVEKYEDDLLRQNSLIHQGWRVFRWTDREVVDEPERIKEQLALFLESITEVVSFDEFLPKQTGDTFELRRHQKEALESLAQMRKDGKTIALLTHAQGAGKTVVAVTDAKRVGGRTLFLAHRQELVLQAYDEIKKLWPEQTTGLFLGDVKDHDADNIAGSIQSLANRVKEFEANAFDYLVIDEAHHAAATTYRKVLGYFRPKFVLGLTATPDRADGQSILELFQESAHRLDLRTAIERGELVPIRCVRVNTNVDLSRVRFNQVQYNRKDIEQTILIPARDRLIVQVYQEHVAGRRAVVFCVNVRHGENVAELFRREGIPAKSVSGRMPRADREKCMREFRRGKINVLCACDILNEGWDCPEVEVLMMARPTLSKVIYLQQLGRGTRKAPGKDCLIVFDFVDNATKYNQSLSLHRVLCERRYRAGALVAAPQEAMDNENLAISNGECPAAVLNIGVWARGFEEIDLFNWQDAVADMLSVSELEFELGTSEGFIRRIVERGEMEADHTLTLGERIYHFFKKDRTESICSELGLERVSAENVKGRFLEYVGKMDMSASYKPVLVLALLDTVDERGRTRLSEVVSQFRDFYRSRVDENLIVERQSVRMSRVTDLDDIEIQSILVGMPFEKFERRKFLEYDGRDLAYVRFNSALWRQLSEDEQDEIRIICARNIESYYERLTQ